VTQVAVVESYEQWLALKLGQGRRQFIDSHPLPFLVWKEGPASELPRPPGDTLRPPHVAFHTGQSRGSIRITAPLASIERARVYAVQKGPDRPFPERVSVGRAPNCDIVLREGSISKLHAHLVHVTPASAEVVDAKSSNGTRVNGVIVQAGERRKVDVGDKVTFGAVTLEWMDAEALYDLL
jgi:pSer/pThr/pTyr-binding forkhead associated (FHA) protein